MASGRHTPDDDNSFLASLVSHVGAAVALIVVVAAGFWAIGQVDAGDGGVEVVSAPSPNESEPAPATSPTPDTQDGTAASPDEPVSSPSPEPAQSPSPTPTPSPSPAPTEPVAQVEPSEVSIQVLDAVLDDDGAAAQSVADELEADGYNVVVVNESFRTYESTTVFYTEGNEDAARQIASQYGFSVVEPKPSNLSDSVDIHLVVGNDRR